MEISINVAFTEGGKVLPFFGLSLIKCHSVLKMLKHVGHFVMPCHLAKPWVDAFEGLSLLINFPTANTLYTTLFVKCTYKAEI